MVSDELDRPGQLQLFLLTEVQCGDGEHCQGRHPEGAPRARLTSRDDGKRNDQCAEPDREETQTRGCRDCRALQRGSDLDQCRTSAQRIGDEHLHESRRRGQSREAGPEHGMHDDRRQETQRSEGQRLGQARQRGPTEIAQAVADERFDVPDEAEHGSEHKEAVDAPTRVLAGASRPKHHDEQHRVQRRSSDEAGDVDQRSGMRRSRGMRRSHRRSLDDHRSCRN